MHLILQEGKQRCTDRLQKQVSGCQATVHEPKDQKSREDSVDSEKDAKRMNMKTFNVAQIAEGWRTGEPGTAS